MVVISEVMTMEGYMLVRGGGAVRSLADVRFRASWYDGGFQLICGIVAGKIAPGRASWLDDLAMILTPDEGMRGELEEPLSCPHQEEAVGRTSQQLSDDTTMLQDFLDRANARKAAKCAGISPEESPRRALAAVDNNRSPPKKGQDLATTEVVDKGGERFTPYRRSGRVRASAPRKVLLGTPSMIPVRRTGGSEPVVIQPSPTKELMMTTRTNTRRNKGSSKPANLRIRELAKGPRGVDIVAKEGKVGAKKVAWDPKLVYYSEGPEARPKEEIMNTTKSKVQKVKGLGTANGLSGAAKAGRSAASYRAATPGHKRKGRTGT